MGWPAAYVLKMTIVPDAIRVNALIKNGVRTEAKKKKKGFPAAIPARKTVRKGF